MNTLQIYDYLVFLVYFFIVAGYGYYVYKRKQTKSVSASHDYFLAEGSLTWWAIGTSLIEMENAEKEKGLCDDEWHPSQDDAA